MIPKTLSVILIVAISFAGSAGAATSQSVSSEPDSTSAPPLESSNSDLETVISEIEEARGFVDRSQFDLDALLDKLDYDRERIEDFVQVQIAFEQYPGLLRGAEGTLMGRAGNALDQSVLLATLLKDAGFEAEIVRSELSLQQARTLVRQMLEPASMSPPPGDLVAIATILGGSGSSVSNDSADPPDPATTEDETQKVARYLLDTVEAHGQQLGSEDSEAALVEEAKDYFWVRHRDGPAGQWTAAHPAFADSDLEPLHLEAMASYRASIPGELQHRFRLEVLLEQKFGDQLQVHTLIPAWERPVSNMLGRSFVIANYPNGVTGDASLEELDSKLSSSEVFVPVFNGEVLPGTRGFDLDGTPYDLEAQGMDRFGATAIFREVGRSLDRATGALEALGDAEETVGPVRALSAQWIEYSLISPGGETRTFRRYLFDRLGVETGRKEKVNSLPEESAHWWEPNASQEFILAGAKYPDALILDEFLVRLAAHARLVQRFLATNELNILDLATPVKEGRGANALVLLALLDQMERPVAADLSATYRSEPTLLAIHQALKAEAQVSFGTDIISNQRRGRRFTNASSTTADVMLQGIWETYTERLVFELLGLETPNYSSAFDQLAEHQAVSGQTTILSQGGDLEPEKISSPLHRDLESGYLAILPEDGFYRSIGWWRVDPFSGATVGVAPDGRGATTSEYVITFGGISGTLIVIHSVSMAECWAKRKTQIDRFGRSPQRFECCVIEEQAKSYRGVLASKWMWAEYNLRNIQKYGYLNCR